MRKLKIDDGPVLYEWVMDKETRKNAPSSESFTYGSHLDWLSNKIADSKSLILIGEFDEERVGQIRFDALDKNSIAISIVVNPKWRGKGIGTNLVREGINRLKTKNELGLSSGEINLSALLKPTNLASKRIFETNGFFLDKETIALNGIVFYKYIKVLKIE